MHTAQPPIKKSLCWLASDDALKCLGGAIARSPAANIFVIRSRVTWTQCNAYLGMLCYT